MKTIINFFGLIFLSANLHAQCSVDFFYDDPSCFRQNTHQQDSQSTDKSIDILFQLHYSNEMQRTILQWSAIEESKVQYYIVQRSEDGIVYENVETIEVNPELQNSYTLTIIENDDILFLYRIQSVCILEDGSKLKFYSKAKLNNIKSIPQAESLYNMGLDWF